jgi:hypothetical protein
MATQGPRRLCPAEIAGTAYRISVPADQEVREARFTMWSTARSKELFDTFIDHPRLTTIISSVRPDGPRLLIDDAVAVADTLRSDAAAAGIPIVVRTRTVDRHPEHGQIIVYHVPDVVGSRMPR